MAQVEITCFCKTGNFYGYVNLKGVIYKAIYECV